MELLKKLFGNRNGKLPDEDKQHLQKKQERIKKRIEAIEQRRRMHRLHKRKS